MKSRPVDFLPRSGPRIVLRRLRAADLPEFQAYRADPEVGRYQGWSPMPSQAAKAFLTEMNKAAFAAVGVWFQLGIADGATDRLIGDIGFCICGPDYQHAELGFSLAHKVQGQGLASEAVREVIDLLFERTTVARVISMTDARNQACIRLLQRVGMRQVGAVNSMFRSEPCVEYVYMSWRQPGVIRVGNPEWKRTL